MNQQLIQETFAQLREHCDPRGISLLDTLERVVIAEFQLCDTLRLRAALDDIERFVETSHLRVVR